MLEDRRQLHGPVRLFGILAVLDEPQPPRGVRLTLNRSGSDMKIMEFFINTIAVWEAHLPLLTIAALAGSALTITPDPDVEGLAIRLYDDYDEFLQDLVRLNGNDETIR